MIGINVAMQQDKVIELLEGLSAGITYTYKEKKGIKLIFEVTGDSQEAAVEAKKAIKAQPWGGVLYFNVEAL